MKPNHKTVLGAFCAAGMALASGSAMAHSGAGALMMNLNIGPSMVAEYLSIPPEGDYLIPHANINNNSGVAWQGMIVQILTWNEYTSQYELSPAGDTISFGETTTTGDADWAIQGGAAGLHVKLNGIYQCNGVDATSYCLGDGTTGQVSNPGSWSWARGLDPDTYTVTLDPDKLLAQPGQNLHVGGYEIEYGSQANLWGLRFTAVAAVPEAETWAQMAAGLALTGVMVRVQRRRKIGGDAT
jgi:hypothetical protein